jgi:predicted RNase H-like HicB family nuclease
MDMRWSGEDETETAAVREVVHVGVEYSTEDEEYGPVYIASCLELAVVAYGKTLDELLGNLRDAIASHLANVDTLAQYNLVPNPRIMIMLVVDL